LLIILAMGLAVRLINLNTPLVDAHSWRQTFTAMIANNFYLHGYKIMYPEVDYNGNDSGYVASEFPVYPFIVALLYKIWGMHDALGKAISIAFYLLSSILVFFLFRKYSSESTARWSLIFYLFLPLNIFYSQAFMPESMMMFCSIGTVYFFDKWAQKRNIIYFLFAAVFFTLDILIKPFTLYLLLPLGYLFFKDNSGIKKTKLLQIYPFLLFIALSLIFPVYWFAFWHKNLNPELFGHIWNARDRWGNIKWWLNPHWYSRVFLQHITENWLVFSGAVFFIMGYIRKPVLESEKVFRWWFIAIIIYFFLIAGGNFPHEYYQFPMVVPVCFFIGKYLDFFFRDLTAQPGLYKKPSSILILFLLFCMIPISAGKLMHRMRGCMQKEYFESGRIIDSTTEKQGLIVVSDYDLPEVIYYSKRKGWHITPDQQSPELIEKYRKKGAEYFSTTRINEFNNDRVFSDYMSTNFRLLPASSTKFKIFELK